MNYRSTTFWQVLGVLSIGCFAAASLVFAGPITGGVGNAPFSKLSVYQGVISIIPSGSTDSVMEIGNNGRDIASTGNTYIRPGGLSTGSDNYVKFLNDTGIVSMEIPSLVQVGPQNFAAEGGEIVFQPSGAYRRWHADVYENKFRLFTDPNSPGAGETFAIDSVTGDIWIAQPGAKLCFADGSCHNWSDFSPSGGSLEAALSAGNKSNKDMILGQGTNTTYQAGFALLDISQTDISKNAIAAKQAVNNNTNRAIYGYNVSASGWAGYFSGRVNITGQLCFNEGNCSSSWGIPNLTQVLGNGNTAPNLHMSLNGPAVSAAPQAALVAMMAPAGNPYPDNFGAGDSKDTIDAYNKSSGYALYAEASNASAFAGFFRGRLKAVHTNADPTKFGSAFVLAGAPYGLGNPDYKPTYGIDGPAGIEAWGGQASAGKTTYALFAGAGSNASGGINYAGKFVGKTIFTGDVTHPAKVTKSGLDVVTAYKMIPGDGSQCTVICGSYGQTCALATVIYSANGIINNYGCSSSHPSPADTNTYLCYCY